MIHPRRLFACFLAMALLVPSVAPPAVQAQSNAAPFDFYTRGPFRPNVPRPQSILGFDVGDFHTNYATMERVINSIAAAAPDRVKITDIGRTNELRQMHLIAISSPENIARLDSIKANVKRLSDPRTTAQTEANTIVEQTPLIVWLAYTIHGNESASFETMMQVVYHLAASEEPATLEMLRNCVVLVNVCENPDGHERFVTWYNSVAQGNPDPLAAEHREPWSVSGRTNRYRFDLNRDNIVASQIETRHMQRAYQEWNPQILVDHHGQPSQYFFPPAAQPVNPNLPRAQTEKWLTAFGRTNAREFDARQWDYYVRDIFDLFYPGYWDSYPALNGATGMTYETDGGGFKGLRWRRDDDTIVTFRSAIAKHFVASLATLETASKNARARLADYYDFKRTAIEEGRTETMKRVILLPGGDPARAAEIAEILARSGIEVGITNQAFRSTRAHGYLNPNATAQAQQIPAGAYIVDLNQPQKRLAKALLEPRTELERSFVQEQMSRFRRNERRGGNATKEDYQFYDITAWSLPIAFNVEAYWTEDAPAVSVTRVERPQEITRDAGLNAINANPTNSARPAFLASSAVTTFARTGGVTGRASVAYIVPYTRNGAASLIYKLLNENFKLAVATRPLNAGGRDYPRGTIVVRVGRNPENIHERITGLARETGVEVAAVNSGFTETGETGVGSETVVAMKRPRIAVIADEPVNQLSYGAMWWTFDRYGVEFTPISIASLRRSEIDKFNVIIMPDGSASGYASAFGKAGTDQLRAWCERGGTLVAIKGAGVWAALKDVNLTSSRLVGSDDAGDGAPSGNVAAGGGAAAAAARREAQTSNEATSREPENTTQTNRELNQAAQGSTPSGQGGGSQITSQPQSEKADGAAPVLPPIASPSARPGKVPEPVPGAVMRATIDRTSPLTFGYDEETLPVLVDSAYFFKPSKEGTNAVVFSEDDKQSLRIAGFVWEGNTERLLRGTAHIIEEPTGRGRVIIYAEDPNYRGIFRTLTRLFFNSFIFQL
ncbi:MAG: M14 family metallopeptidase [Pyrinomonadaceae bacterium MAG19_C2-C3]|nr:M14 family metallopeptidase [Pyrinomonadaceae bacterium MAG19_C2-C3]